MTAVIQSPGSALAETFARPAATQIKTELRVLQIFSVLSVGGAETWLMSLLKYFREHEDELPFKVKLDVLLTGGTEAVFDEEAKALGARLFYVPFRRVNVLGFMRQFRRILREGNYDAIHDHQDYIAGMHLLMGVGYLPPVRIAHVHNPLYNRTQYAIDPVRKAMKSGGKKLLIRFATHIMGTSRQIVTEYGFDDFESRNLILGAAHCGFDATSYQGNYAKAHNELCRELGWNNSAKIILFVGRLESEPVVHLGREMTHKNPAFALEVARECIQKDSNICVLMIGAGEVKRKEFEALTKQWGLEKKIRFFAVRRDVPKLMLGSDLLLFPSLAEGLGMVVVEAQAAGLRVLASDTTPRECAVVSEMVNFFPLSASTNSWTDKAVQLLSLPRADSLSSNAAIRDSAFSIENSAKRLLELYAGHPLP